jgi:hypothetical protein
MRSVRPARPALAIALLACLFLAPAPAVSRAGDYPEPSPYPISWELKFDHSKPKRIVVTIPGQGPRAFWYVTYTVTNETQDDQTFLPVFEMLTRDGKIIPSDKGVPFHVFDAIKRREQNRYLLPSTKVGGVLRVGEDQARDGVAIWPEPATEMGSFSIFVTGLSGETVTMKMVDGKPVKIKPENISQELKGVKPEDVMILHKTLQLNHVIYGDDRFPGLDEVNVKPEQWVMR